MRRGFNRMSYAPSLLLISLLTLLLGPLPVAAQFGGTPNDPLYDQQWALERIGAPCAWQRSTGRQDVIVAVIDSGVDMNHPDLVEHLRRDGFDFVDGDEDPSDANGHGTHVAGIVAATLNNAEGVSGLAPGVQILPVRVMDAEGSGNDRSIAAGISYAVERGVRVINLSLGATLLLGTPEASPQISRAISRAIAAGVVVVVAAGNDFVPLPNAIVGENEAAIVVAAATRGDLKAPFSNSGPWIDVTAPGERILSTMPTYEVYLTSAALPEDERFRNTYDFMSGTSQAAPYVAALAALILSANPEFTPAQVDEALKAGAFNIYPNHPSYYQRLKLLGAGRIDACASLGGPGAPSSALDALLRSSGVLALLMGAAGLCLLILTLAGVAVAVARRRRVRPAPAPTPAPPPRPAPTPAPPPRPAPIPRTGDTLVTSGPWGRLVIVAGPAAPSLHTLSGVDLVIGRADEAGLSLPADPTISRRHVRLSRYGASALLEDLGSSHGTFVNNQRIASPTVLRSGDIITLGQTSIRFEM